MPRGMLGALCFAILFCKAACNPAPLALNISYPALDNGPKVGGQQNPSVAPPLPILALSEQYMRGQLTNVTDANTTYSNSTRKDLGRRYDPSQGGGPVQCGPGNPCLDKSCCNSDNKCGFGPEHCSKAAPAFCLSNCDATAMCGRDSKGARLKCGENLCCSYFGWCGTTELHCNNSDPIGRTQPCQKGFGGCQVVPSPKCDPGKNTAGARKIGYYNANNVNTRSCNRVSPSQIQTDGFTHLNFAFAGIDPRSFQVAPMFQGDENLYREFTALQKPGLETWLAVGGFDFSDVGPTHQTWSQMCSSSANRAIFISSLVNFLEAYKFQGVDLDWEYPSADERGGQPEDITNQVSLVKELRAALGAKYGLSVVLAPDYWYLRGSDPKGMEPYVDWFGFMTYDLHGFWDANTPALGNIIRPQTDIRDIKVDSLPLWFDYLDPAKVNFGLAYYGRGFTVSDKSCMYPGCKFSGPSKPAPCTDFAGVMSLREIEQYIAGKKLVPELLKDPMIKQITWDDQWIGYDDNETIAMKMGVANSLCFGGTMVWSVDFASKGSGDGADLPGDGPDGQVIYFDPNMWSTAHPPIACQPPCTMVLPPWPLSSTSTIVWPPMTTWLLSSSAGSTYTKTTVLTVAPFTITEIPFWPITATAGDTSVSSVSVVQSVMPPSFVITLPGTEATFPPSQILPPTASATAGQPTATSTLTISPDSTCGLSGHNYTCLGSTFGNCCSRYGHCGSGDAFCTGGCDPRYGTCESNVSNDGTCGASHGSQSCLGSKFGDCCSTFGNCGSSDAYCVTYCDPIFGKCSGAAQSSSGVPPPIIFPTGSHIVTIQPQPTVSITPPPSVTPTPSFTDGPPGPTCTGRCGQLRCDLFGCPPHGCGIFACDGGCSIFGCGGFPTLNGPDPICPASSRALGLCGPGPGPGPGPDPSDPSDPNDPNDPDDNCEEETQTALDCFEYWGPTTEANGATTTTVTSSTCYKDLACSATTTTRTITTSQTPFACPVQTPNPVYIPDEAPWGGCYACDVPGYDYGVYYNNGDDAEDTDATGSNLARRSEYLGSDYMPDVGSLNKRDNGNALSKIGTCNLPSAVFIPPYTNGINWLASEVAGNIPATQAAMPRWYKSTVAACLPTATLISHDRLQNEAENPGNSYPSIDHAWEKSLLRDFFKDALNRIGGPDNCNHLSQIFFPTGENCLELIFAAIPGNDFWDFIGMDSGANRAKGSIKDKNFANPERAFSGAWRNAMNQHSYALMKVAYTNAIDKFDNAIVGCQLWSDSNVERLFDVSNSRIYGRLLDIDTSAATRGLPKYDWAAKYKAYIEDFLDSISASADGGMTKLLDGLTTRYEAMDPKNSGADEADLPPLQSDWAGYKKRIDAASTIYKLGTGDSICKFRLNLNWAHVPYPPAQQCGNGGGIFSPITGPPIGPPGSGPGQPGGPSGPSGPPSCYPAADPDRGYGQYCTCDGIPGDYPILDPPAAPCAYTALPTTTYQPPTPNPTTIPAGGLQCYVGQNPDQCWDSFCQCDGFSGVFQTITGPSPCAFTTVPVTPYLIPTGCPTTTAVDVTPIPTSLPAAQVTAYLGWREKCLDAGCQNYNVGQFEVYGQWPGHDTGPCEAPPLNTSAWYPFTDFLGSIALEVDMPAIDLRPMGTQCTGHFDKIDSTDPSQVYWVGDVRCRNGQVANGYPQVNIWNCNKKDKGNLIKCFDSNYYIWEVCTSTDN